MSIDFKSKKKHINKFFRLVTQAVFSESGKITISANENTVYFVRLSAWAIFLSALPFFLFDIVIIRNLGYSVDLTLKVYFQHFCILVPLLALSVYLCHKLPWDKLYYYYALQLFAFTASSAFLCYVGAGELFMYFLPSFTAVVLGGCAMVYIFPRQTFLIYTAFTVSLLVIRYVFMGNNPDVDVIWSGFFVLNVLNVLITFLLRNLYFALDKEIYEKEEQIVELKKTNALLDITLNENQFGLAGFDDQGRLVFERGSSLGRIFNMQRNESEHQFDYREMESLKTFIEQLTNEDFEAFFGKIVNLDLEDSNFILSAYRLKDLTILTHMDVTQMRKIEDELRSHQTLSVIGEITSGVAHNYNNALAVALHNLEALPSRKLGLLWEDFVQPSIEAIEQSAEISKKLLALAGRQKLEIEKFDISETLNSMKNLLQSAIGSDIKLSISTSEPLWVKTDKREFESAILNLVINGRNASKKSKSAKISIHARMNSNYAVVSVIDNGHGIEPSILQKIFDPFFSTHSQKDSSGLGLSTVKGFVEQSNGFVEVQSRAGLTEFRLFFPVILEASEQKAPINNNARPIKMRPIPDETVLFVDDNVQLLNSLSRLLKSMGVNAVYESNPQKALRVFNQNTKIRSAVLDLSMPGINGIELGEKMLKLRPDVKLYLMTGEISAEQVTLAKNSGFTDVCIKPLRAKQLISLLGQELNDYENENVVINFA